MKKKSILVTGFGKFGNYKVNPTEEFLLKHKVLGNYNIHSLIFPPNTFSAGAANFGQKIVKTAKKFEAKAIISLGLSSEVKGLRIEGQALNWSDSKYGFRSEGDRKLNVNYQPWHFKEINLKYWDINSMFEKFRFLNIKFEEKISRFPGYYCCNALMYRTLEALELNLDFYLPYVFLHIPCTAEAVAGVEDFDKSKELITMETLRQIMVVVSESYQKEPKALPCSV